MIPEGHHSPSPRLPCHNTLYHTLLCYPQRALLFPVHWSPHSCTVPFPVPGPFPFCYGIFSLLMWTCCLGPRETTRPTNLCSTGVGASRAAGQSHGHIRSHQAHGCPQVQEDCQQNYSTKVVMNTVLWESGGATLLGQHCGPLLPWEALRRPLNTRPNQPLIWIQGFQCQVIVGESKGVRAPSSSTATCFSVPPKYPKVPFNNRSPTSSIFTRDEVKKQLPLSTETQSLW